MEQSRGTPGEESRGNTGRQGRRAGGRHKQPCRPLAITLCHRGGSGGESHGNVEHSCDTT